MSVSSSAVSLVEETDEERAGSVERTIQIGFAVALAILGIIGIVSYFNVIRLTEDARWVAHTSDVISNLESLLSSATDVETADRGYAITGEDSYLEPFQKSRKEGIATVAVEAIDGRQCASTAATGDAQPDLCRTTRHRA